MEKLFQSHPQADAYRSDGWIDIIGIGDPVGNPYRRYPDKISGNKPA
jgi:hypothetical protein